MGAILLCPCCYKAYRKDAINDNYLMCPDIHCDGGAELFEIDELMLKPIQILLSKGYSTQYCCSGHIYEQNKGAYIKFYPIVTLPSIPEGWEYEDDFNIIRLNNKTLFDNNEYNKLIDWCENLDLSDEY